MTTQKQDNRKADVLEKIRKLMNKTVENGATEAEAEAAMKKCQRLMLEYNIENEEITISPLDIDMEYIDNNFKSHEYRYWFWDLLTVLADAYNCDLVKKWQPKTGSYYRIIGTNEDRAMIKNMFESLYPIIRNIESKRYDDRVKEFRKLLAEENPRYADFSLKTLVRLKYFPSRKMHFNSYYKGFLRGLASKLQADKNEFLQIAENAEKWGLIVVKKDALIKDFIDQQNWKAPKIQSTALKLESTAYYQGKDDGSENSTTLQLNS